MKNNHTPSLSIKLLMLAISLTCFAVGLVEILTEFAPARSSRFGLTNAYFGEDAKLIGVISILIGLLPLLFFL